MGRDVSRHPGLGEKGEPAATGTTTGSRPIIGLSVNTDEYSPFVV
jgi:hypothetical protein